MTLSYSQMVAQLCKPGADIISQMTASQAHLLHMAIGMAGEAAEVVTEDVALLENVGCGVMDPRTLILELGDYEFYLEGFKAGIGVDVRPAVAWQGAFSTPEIGSRAEANITLLLRTNALLDCVKKHAIYGKKTICLGEDILAIEACLEFFATRVAGVTREEVRARNMAKLAKRYPGFQFSTSAAIAQADKETE